MSEHVKRVLRRAWADINYRWCMVHAYVYQDCSPVMSGQYLQYADSWALELWRIDRGLA